MVSEGASAEGHPHFRACERHIALCAGWTGLECSSVPHFGALLYGFRESLSNKT